MGTVRLQVRERAEARGLNLSQVQRRSGLTMGMVRRYWHNQTRHISLDALAVLAELLETTAGELLYTEPYASNASETKQLSLP